MNNQLIFEWQQAAEELKTLRPLEMKLRKQVVEESFAQYKTGTNYADLGNDWRLKFVYKEEPKVDEAAVPAMLEELDKVNPALRDTLFKYKPTLVNSVYKKLTDDERKIVDEVITLRPASPTLEVVPPKGTK
ncbi:hypothetical protein NVP2117O_73 [Vibrio phage 2.117.O._10N.261.45.E9]|nr:hypothetical protein NVP1117O_73 [Vibrio phage 1.117.O._10N.261.45.E9]AUR95474.1 hypothetical protein NVP1207B_67 [Vibrio phage 1.207.B._10N.222.51.C2]AUS02365.1 hypothetical protein NVP2117O_73 [Vibrio phage 2.117.O._10N.261.45.E9]